MRRALWALMVVVMAISPVMADSAEEILATAGIDGGVVAIIGCGDGSLTTELGMYDSMVVQGLDTEKANITATREKISMLGLGGTVSAELIEDCSLPYVDSLVNLVIAEQLGDITLDEINRVLCPGGVAMIKDGGKWKKTVKAWPKDIADWTHYLYDPQGTSVSDDVIAGPPKGMRWEGGPFWARSHEHTASMQAMVSANGKVFYVMDEGPTESIQLPTNMILTARDAFNGTVLWKRSLKDWWNALFPLKSGPGWLPRRLVAIGDRVYIAPGIGQDILCLDASTGEVVQEYKGTASTFELIVEDGVVLASVDTDRKLCDYAQQNANCWSERDRASRKFAWNSATGEQKLMAIDAASGKVLWQRDTPVAPMTLVANDKLVCYLDGSAMIGLDRKTGEELWSADTSDMLTIPTGYSGPRVVLLDDKLVFSPMGNITVISTETGEILWTIKGKPKSGHYSLEDFYILGDRIWALQRGNHGAFTIYDLGTGKIVETISNPIKSFYIHQRCYPGRATQRYQLPPMMGIQTYDMEDDTWENNHWVRGGCVYGVMPANGLVYATPHACACYYQSKLNGFNGLAPTAESSEAPPAAERLTMGPAYGEEGEVTYTAADWPTFRHDNTRSGTAGTTVPAKIKETWKSDFGTKMSQPVVGGGLIYTCAVDEHTVYALDPKTGKEAWHFIAGGRVNSSPTLYRGLAIFGCADGNVYALRASDGELAWKFQAAPNDRQAMSYGQLESVWPLAGSVLIEDGKLYTVAGRSMFLDGGLRMIILEPLTGELIAENVMDRAVPGTDQQLDDLMSGKHMPVALPDILSSDGKHVYMKSQTFTMDGKRVRIKPLRPDTQYDEEVHLFSPISYLDDSWHQRTYWIYGRAAGEGWAEFQYPPKRVPCGRILCIDDDNVYGYGRDPELLCNTSVSEYRLFSTEKDPRRKIGVPGMEGKWPEGKYPAAPQPLVRNSVDWHKLREQPMTALTALTYNWLHEEPAVMARAMVLTDDLLFVAGPRDVVDEKTMWGRSNEEDFQKKMSLQADWLAGKHGGIMEVYSKKDGKKLAEYELADYPKFDGMIAADGQLLMVTEDGSIICYQGE